MRAVFTSAADGDLCIDAPTGELELRRRAIAPGRWTWLHQVHGDQVVVVRTPGEHAGEDADAAVTAVPGAVLAVQTADCAPVLFAATSATTTVVGAAHAGWRGLELGVLQRTVAALHDLGAVDVVWTLGPCISPAAYEFGEADLDRLCARYGDGLRGRTSGGAPALDLRAGVRAALAETDATERTDGPIPCTATGDDHFSWRARRDAGRQAGVIWIEPS